MTRISKTEFLQVCKIRANIFNAFQVCLPAFAPALEHFDGKALNKRFINFAAGNDKGEFKTNDLTVYASVYAVGSCHYIELYCKDMFRENWRTKLIEHKTTFQVDMKDGKIDGRNTVKNIVASLQKLEKEENEYLQAIDKFEEVEKAFSIIEQEKSRIARVNSHLSAYLLNNLMSY